MKIFEVRIDNDPGGWKSGNDNHLLVIADDEESAIEKVKNKWGEISNFDDGKHTTRFGFFEVQEGSYVPYISNSARLSAKEIIFDGYMLSTIREEKLKRIIEE